MQDKIDKIVSLIDKHLKDELNEVERTELDSWLSESERNRSWFEQITDKEVLTRKLIEFAGTDKEAVWQKTLNRINADGNVIRMYPKRAAWQKYVAAAAILILAAGAWFYTRQSNPKEAGKTPLVSNQLRKKNIVPGTDKAIMTLADDSKVALGKDENRVIAKQGAIEVSVANGQVNYKLEGSVTVQQANQYNMITTPNGGQYKVVLPDGSKVWLNAASSLRFPIVFAGNERLVQLTGEAYFEVAKIPMGRQKMPFKIAILNSGRETTGKVEVVGTHFNVMAYDNEVAVQTTLLEGSVKVTAINSNGKDKSKFIKPGQQAQLADRQIKIRNVGAEGAAGIAAWKDGYLPAVELDAVVRQIARWYDVEVKYEAKVPNTEMVGKVPRNMQFDNVLKALESKGIHTRMEGDTLVIM